MPDVRKTLTDAGYIAIGLGVMGFTDVVEKLGLSYESEEAYALIDEIMEHVSYAAIDESADLARLISSPIVSREDQGQAMAAVAERLGLGDIVQNFLGVLARSRRLAALPAIIAGFQSKLAQHRGEETAEVTSAVPLDEAQLSSVKEAVAAYAGKPVQLTAAVDPALLGGLVVRIGSRMIDA